METPTPSTRADIEARRIATATLADGTVIRCRRTSLVDLLALGAVPMEFVAAAQGIKTDPTPQRLKMVRDSLEQTAAWAALEPRLTQDLEPPPSTAVWLGLFSLEDLGDIYAAVTGIPPVGAVDATSFRGDADAAPRAVAPDGEGVRAETEQLAVGGSVDLQHG